MAPRDWTAWLLYGNSWLLHRKQSLLIRDSKPLPLFISVLFFSYEKQSSRGLFGLSLFQPLARASRERAGTEPEGPFCSCAAAPKGCRAQGHRVTSGVRFTAKQLWLSSAVPYWLYGFILRYLHLQQSFLFSVLLMLISPPALCCSS